MVAPQYEIVWTKRATKQMQQAFEYISKTSLKNAEMVLNEIVFAVERAISNPKIYPTDKFKVNNDGTFREFEKHRFRISYRFKNNVIRVFKSYAYKYVSDNFVTMHSRQIN